MPTIRNRQESEKAAAGAEKLPGGTFIVECVKTWTSPKTGRYNLKFAACSGEHAGKIVTDGFDLSHPTSRGILMQRVKAMGVELETDGEDAYFDDDAPLGCFAEVDVVQNGEYTNIKRLRPVDRETVAAMKQAQLAAEGEPGATPDTPPVDEEDLPF